MMFSFTLAATYCNFKGELERNKPVAVPTEEITNHDCVIRIRLGAVIYDV